MLRLIITCDAAPGPPFVAHNLKSHDVIMALAEDAECHVIVYPTSDANWESLRAYWKAYDIKWHRLQRRFTRQHWRAARRRLSLPTVTRDFPSEERIIRDLQGDHPDARLLIDFLSGAPLLRKIRQGVVLSGHDCFSRLFREEGRYAETFAGRWHFRIRRVFALNAERHLAHLADRLHLVSQVDADEFLRINPKVKPVVIPLSRPAPPPHTLKPIAERQERVLWGSLLLPVIRRGMRTFLAEALRKGSGTLRGFLLLGRVDEAEARRILPEMDALGIRYQAKVDDLNTFLGNTRMVVLTDLSGTGQKTRTIDAMAHGCCVFGLSEAFRGINNDREVPAFIEAANVTELLSRIEGLDADSMASIASAGQGLVGRGFSMGVLRRRWRELINSLPALRLSDQGA
jgi:hypothetical protein